MLGAFFAIARVRSSRGLGTDLVRKNSVLESPSSATKSQNIARKCARARPASEAIDDASASSEDKGKKPLCTKGAERAESQKAFTLAAVLGRIERGPEPRRGKSAGAGAESRGGPQGNTGAEKCNGRGGAARGEHTKGRG